MNNIIFGVFNGYNSLFTKKGGIYYFMKSLRKYNENCKIVIICEKKNIFNDLIRVYAQYAFRFQKMAFRFR